MRNYLYALAKNWPNVQAHSFDAGVTYAGLVHDGGDPLPTAEELDTYMLEEARQAKWELIKAERERRRQAGVLVSGHWYHSDDTSRIQHIGLLLMGQNMPVGIMWKTMPNNFVEMTPALAVTIFNVIGQKDMQIFASAEQHRQQLLASPDPDAYDHLNTAPAWPQVFGE